MTCLSEVNGKVEKMNKRLGKIESCQVVLKKRCKRMKAMEKKLEKIEDCQYYLKKKAKKVETLDGRIDGIEKEMKEMKENEEDNETNEGFDYQGMDYDWGGQRNDSNGRVKKRLRRTIKGSEEETEPEPEAEAEEDKEKEDEEESEEEAQTDDRGSEEEKELEPEAEAEENKEKEVETEARVEVQDEVEMNETNEKIPEKEPDEVQDEVEMNEANEIEEEVETEARVEVETEKTPTPPHGRNKAAAARRQVLTTPEKLFEKAEKMVEEEVIDSVLVPTVDKEPLMARIMAGEPDYENEEGVSNLWSTWLTVKEKSIFWQEFYELDVAAREFPQKKDKRKVHEEASSSNTSLEDVLKGFEERLMTCLSEVNGKVEKMNKRLGKLETCQVVLKKRCKRMKAMEKKLEKIKDCQYYLKKKAKKVETLDERIYGIQKEMKEMKEKEEDNENNEGFDYQGMDYDWGGQRNDSNGVDATTKEPEDADMVENTEVVEENESEKEVQKDDREPDEVQDEVEMNEANEIEEEVETKARVEVETEKTPTPPRGRTKAAAARRQVLTTPEKLFEKDEKMVEEEVEEPEEEAEEMVEEEVEEPEEEAEEMVEDEVEEPEKETEKYTEEEKQEWYMVVYEGSTCETKEADKGAAKPSGTEGKKHSQAVEKKGARSEKREQDGQVWEGERLMGCGVAC
ncbi:hypothetical protein DY000_02034117 [Brassica cretica]|uniref:DUF287 domain-containing protein n=1 Tax=Brassica cretica TaxID=69181 RepID=A0ABQ7DK71_BRACR|nr:hypothetical protein DY000_02034117 [Brassica cretica]